MAVLLIENGISFQVLKTEFLAGERFGQVYLEARRFAQSQHSEEEIDRMLRRMGGAFFEQLGYLFLRHSLPGSRILSPEDTLALFRTFYPRRPIINHLFQTGIRGVTPPDGIIFQDPENGPAVHWVEYTMSSNCKKPGRCLNALAISRDKMPGIFGQDPRLLFVIPENHEKYFTGKRLDTDIMIAPIRTTQVLDLVTETWRRYRNGLEDGNMRQDLPLSDIQLSSCLPATN